MNDTHVIRPEDLRYCVFVINASGAQLEVRAASADLASEAGAVLSDWLHRVKPSTPDVRIAAEVDLRRARKHPLDQEDPFQ